MMDSDQELKMDSQMDSNNTFLVDLVADYLDNESDAFEYETSTIGLIADAWLDIVLIVMYSILVIASLIGNALVVRVLYRAKCPNYLKNASYTSTNCTRLLIMNLAICDLLLTTFNIPINLLRFIMTDWPLGNVLCTLIPFIQSVCAHCSSWTMLVIALERFLRILRPEVSAFQQRETTGPVSSMSCAVEEITCQTNVTLNARNSSLLNRESLANLKAGKQSNENILAIHNAAGSQGVCMQLISWLYAMFCCCLPVRWQPPKAYCPVSRCLVVPIGGNSCKGHMIVMGVWVISIALSTPHACFSKVQHIQFEDLEMTRCRSNVFDSTSQAKVFSAYTFCSQYLMPIGITAYFYLHIGFFLWRQQAVGSVSLVRQKTLVNGKKRRVTALMMVVLVFAICWLPLNLYILLIDFEIITMNVSCYNPFIYSWYNHSFRRKLLNLIRCVVLRRIVFFCCREDEPPVVSRLNSRQVRLNNRLRQSVEIARAIRSAAEQEGRVNHARGMVKDLEQV